MNLIEIGKNPEILKSEKAEQPKNLEIITENLTQPSQLPEESPIKLKVEKDLLMQSFERAKEFMRTQKKQIQMLEEERQTILSDRQRLREEVRKSTVGIQCLTTELSETQKLNQSLQQSNDDLRNRNGLKSRSEQELLEEEIKDVRDQNSKLQIQVNQSSVEAVEQAQQKQEEAEKKVRTIQCQYNKLQENAETVKEKADQKIKSLKKEMKEKTSFWRMLYMVFVVFEIIKSTVVQNDLFACIKVLIRVWCRCVEWVIRPSELNILGEKEYFSTEWSWCLRVMAIVIVVGIVIAGEMFVLKKIEQYRRVWDKYSIRFIVVSLEMIIISGDALRRFMPINLVVLFGMINIAVMEIRIYCRGANEIH